jgi:transposase
MLKAGDILIMDNSKVHGGKHTIAILTDLLTAAGMLLCFMPNYSPELSSAEQVHNYSKTDI